MRHDGAADTVKVRVRALVMTFDGAEAFSLISAPLWEWVPISTLKRSFSIVFHIKGGIENPNPSSFTASFCLHFDINLNFSAVTREEKSGMHGNIETENRNSRKCEINLKKNSIPRK